ncbi:hypothetical protein D3C77_499650 [compost metagenome]
MSASRDDLDRALSVAYAEIDTLRTKLGEAHVLLKSCAEMIDDGVGRSEEEWRIIRRLRTALSASAEPSAPNEDDYMPEGVVEAAIHGQLIDLPSAPVERDERAAFEASYVTEYNTANTATYTAEDISALRKGCGYGPRPYLNGQWEGWQARAALERKP